MRSLENLRGFEVQGEDSEIGSVHGFLFRDDSWVITYIVVDTGKWLPGRKAIISPMAIDTCDWVKKSFSTSLTKERVKKGPDIDSEKPVSRQKEIELNRYYGWPMPRAGIPGAALPSIYGPIPPPESGKEFPGGEENDSHLRSTREVIGYRIEARNGELGHLEGFLADDEAWVIRYVIVSLGKWLPGKQVLVAPEWIERVSWQKRKVYVDLLKDTVRNCPEYDPYAQVGREYETALYDYYGRPKYWEGSNRKR